MEPTWEVVWLAVTFVGVTIGGLVVRRLALAAVRRWPGDAETREALERALSLPSALCCVIAGVYVTADTAREWALLSARWSDRLGLVLQAAIIVSITVPLARLASVAIAWLGHRQALGGSVTGLAQTTARMLVLVVGGLMMLSAVGVQITPILTALGVGGIAVALALQEPLANLFSGVHLLADRPIRVGDYIKVSEGAEGTVIDIGWRATRLRTLANNVVVVPNKTMTQATLTNYSLPEPRLALGLKISVDQAADPDRVEAILADEVSRAVGPTRGLLAEPPPGVAFSPGLGEHSLDFTVNYQVAEFVDQYPVQTELRKRLLRRLRQEGIEMAVPAQTIRIVRPRREVARPDAEERSARPPAPRRVAGGPRP